MRCLRALSDALLITFFICAAFLLGAYLQWQADQQWTTSWLLTKPDTHSFTMELRSGE